MFAIPRRCAELINQSGPIKVKVTIKVKIYMAIFHVRSINLNRFRFLHETLYKYKA